MKEHLVPGLQSRLRRLKKQPPTPQPTVPRPALVLVQHQMTASPVMISEFFIFEDVEEQHRGHIIDELGDIEEINHLQDSRLDIRFEPRSIAIGWTAPKDWFEQICRQVEIEEDVLMALRDIFGWSHVLVVEHFGEDFQDDMEHLRLVRLSAGVGWRVA